MSIAVEQQVLALMMNFPNALVSALGKVDVNDFTDEMHKALFNECRRQFEAGLPFSIQFMPAELKEGEAGKYTAAVVTCLVGATGLETYCTILKDATAKRKLAQVASWLTEAAQGDDNSGDIAARATTDISAAFDGVHGMKKLAETLNDIDLDGTTELAKFYPSQMPQLDKALDGGFFAGRFYGIAARQKKGKSAMLGTFAYNIAQAGGRVAYITLEMDAREVSQRMLARAGNVRPSVFRHADNLAKVAPRLREAREHLAKSKIGIISAPRMSLDKLRLTLCGLGYGKAADVVIVDYLQLVAGQERGQNGAEHLDNVAQTLAEMAKVHGFCVITAVQLNRDDMVRGGDGLLNACDMAFKLDTTTFGNPDGSERVEAWLEMLATRYTAYKNIGDKDNPAFVLKDEGPYYAER